RQNADPAAGGAADRFPPTFQTASTVVECEELVDGADGGRSLADRSRNSFGRTRSNVANREQSRATGLERQRPATESGPALAQLLISERTVGEDETALVEGGTSA